MATGETFILRAALDGRRSIYRDIEIEPSKSLDQLAQAIVSAFGFDFDHAFGFYSGLTRAKMMRVDPRYELFVDMGEADPGVLSVKKTKVSQAFPKLGHTLIFLFDYGDNWHFRVSLKETATKQPKLRYPRVVTVRGDAPPQYPDPDGESDEGGDA
ncbi:IS1096 element passenger TnpR family protein [Bradyrhizobium sp.]|uniref:IS1096 element passenger TnpR family protein n=1 Tax=Bradyrhizobium sp. TaxID=376 RepID=UPI003C5C9D40